MGEPGVSPCLSTRRSGSGRTRSELFSARSGISLAKLQAVVGELIAGRYELEELVGSGGMSNVFRAHDRLLERTVALKILHEQYTRDEDYVERFRREARAVAQLTHPNIVTVIDRGEQDGRQFIVFEYVEGQNLKELSARGPLDPREAIRLALQVAHALSFAHARGLVHRDVKPQNVLLNDEGQAKVTDFGIARSLDVHGVTQTGTVLGTSDYIAPEQARGQKVDPRTDIYSVGIALIVLLAALLVAGGAYLLLSNESAKKALHVSSAASKPVQLQGLTAYDPEGDGSEHGEDAHFATDHNAGTSWNTERYDNF